MLGIIHIYIYIYVYIYIYIYLYIFFVYRVFGNSFCIEVVWYG